MKNTVNAGILPPGGSRKKVSDKKTKKDLIFFNKSYIISLLSKRQLSAIAKW